MPRLPVPLRDLHAAGKRSETGGFLEEGFQAAAWSEYSQRPFRTHRRQTHLLRKIFAHRKTEGSCEHGHEHVSVYLRPQKAMTARPRSQPTAPTYRRTPLLDVWLVFVLARMQMSLSHKQITQRTETPRPTHYGNQHLRHPTYERAQWSFPLLNSRSSSTTRLP